VISAKVSLEKGEAEVEFDEKKAALGKLKAAVEKAGFKAG
jgi:copper chaperone CopZ